MIHSLTVQNFLSFKDKTTFSFEATKDKHLEDEHVVEVAKGVRLLKLAIIYGYNASGKSNFIEVFRFLKDFWFNVFNDKEKNIEMEPFLLDNISYDRPSNFKLIFYVKGVKHVYSLSVKKNIVLNEELAFYTSVQPTNIFERKYVDGVSEITFGSKTKITKSLKNEISVKCLPNISFFAAYNQVNANVKEVEFVLNWFRNQLMQSITPSMNLRDYTKRLIHKDNNCKASILQYLKNADFNISNIKTEEIEKDVSDDFISSMKDIPGFPASEIKRLEKERKIRNTEAHFKHTVINDEKEEHFYFSMDQQSEGTRRVFGLAGVLFKIMEKNAFLAIDEIESKLHPHLIEYVLERFLKDSNQAQLLVATHYDNLFDEDDLLRKDNFWFAEKGENGSTNLYPLHKFNGLNRISSLQKAYKYGKFGAIPNMES